MSVYVVAQLAPRLRDEVAGRAVVSTAARNLRKVLAEHDAVVLPRETPAAEAGEAPYVTIQVPDMERANGLAAALRKIKGVETAYVKPGEELP
jgi:hypothetical protein